VGTDLVAKSAPDGHTLGVVVTAHVINPSLRPNMPYDTLKDLAAVSQVSVQHLVIAAHPSLEANTVAELIALAKKNPGKLGYATPGSGTAMHLSIELLKSQAGIDLMHVPYKGGFRRPGHDGRARADHSTSSPCSRSSAPADQGHRFSARRPASARDYNRRGSSARRKRAQHGGPGARRVRRAVVQKFPRRARRVEGTD
jgi:hypothetical protein